MRILLLISMLIFGAQAAAADKVYKKVNPDGSIEYTDQPSGDAEEIPVTEVPSIKLKPSPRIRIDASRDKKQQEYSYKQIVIESPGNDQTIRDNAGNLTLQGFVEPAVQQGLGHELRWIMDGEPLEQQTLSVQLTNVSRGTHQVQLQIVDKDDKLLGASPAVTFHLKRYFTRPANPAPNYNPPNKPAPSPPSP